MKKNAKPFYGCPTLREFIKSIKWKPSGKLLTLKEMLQIDRKIDKKDSSKDDPKKINRNDLATIKTWINYTICCIQNRIRLGSLSIKKKLFLLCYILFNADAIQQTIVMEKISSERRNDKKIVYNIEKVILILIY